MAESNDFRNTVEELFKGMDSFITSKTVVGDPIQAGEMTIVPLIDVTFAVGAGAGQKNEKNPGAGGGMGGKMSPTALLIIYQGTTKLINVKNQEGGMGKILDMVPDLVNKFASKVGNKGEAEEAEAEEE